MSEQKLFKVYRQGDIILRESQTTLLNGFKETWDNEEDDKNKSTFLSIKGSQGNEHRMDNVKVLRNWNNTIIKDGRMIDYLYINALVDNFITEHRDDPIDEDFVDEINDQEDDDD